jgi:hypothetical protein
MSAINVFLDPAAAHIVTDGALYERDGTLVAAGQKVATFAHLPAAIAVRGASSFLPLLSIEINASARSFDELLEIIVAKAEAVFAVCAAMPGQARFKSVDVILAGWSETRECAEAYGLFNYPAHGAPSWQLVPLEGGLVSPGDYAFHKGIQAAGIDPLAADFDAATDGLRIVQAQRARAWPITGTAETAHIVGAFAQLTTVTQDAITTRILERWPDKMGQKIGTAAHV